MKLLWKVARTGRRLKTKAITLLTGAVAVREPLQRSTTNYTGKRLDERIGSRAANVESILILIVGEVSQQECGNCLANNGPWAKCVRFLDIDRTITASPACSREFPGHRRGRSSQSSINSLDVRLNIQGDKAEAGLAMVENLERALRRMQAEIGLDDSRNEAIHNAMRAENFAELIVPARAFTPTTTPTNTEPSSTICFRWSQLLEITSPISNDPKAI
ncbi:hypothetical protein N7519_000557 [Penicillium mononematosum]|uniref:uncharacterized protein n=1 Tax=Penicillium mononematosum TaxID=268346 RepID=UPI002548D964|nr:uncharacterized protein N7519_000557 [Penicillium mononematosum]KAJ6190536.1 hypothetical protein N7519_000557 [Penicillium mononematosum]